MWFNRIQVCQFKTKPEYQPEQLEQEMLHHAFKPCSALVPTSYGFVSPIDNDPESPLVYAHNGYIIFCMKIQEKLLPATVLREQLQEKIFNLEKKLGKRISRDEKQQMKDELQHTLLGQAFSKSSKVYAYIDTRNGRLVINTTTTKKLELFFKLTNQVLSQYNVHPYTLKSPTSILTSWLRDQDYPNCFTILDKCSLEQNKEKSKINFSHNDLFCDGIKSLLEDGHLVTKLRLNWCGKINFTVQKDLSITNIRFLDEVKDLAKDGLQETAADRFAADFFIMTETLDKFLEDILIEFVDNEAQTEESVATEAVAA